MQTLPADAAVLDTQPTSIGPYRVMETIGRGGSGVVYRAVGPKGEDVALKTLSRTSEWGLASLRAEIHALRRVRHDGVVRVLDDGVDGSRPWFAMERIDGTTLAARATSLRPHHHREARSQWTDGMLRPLLELMVRVCNALAAVHEAGIVHRDLKPDNVLLRDAERPVIIDFGLAVENAPGDARAVAAPSPVAGTPAYMAPEQLTGEVLDARADLYALGCILFELLAGAPPPKAVSDRRPSRFVEGIPATLDALVVSLLQRRPRDRIGHAGDVAACLESLLARGTEKLPRHLEATGMLRQWLYRPLLTGRAETLEQISAGLARLHTGRGSFIVITGESGIGKTYIASEIARRAAADATILVVASEPPAGARTPLACWSRLFDLAADCTIARPQSPIATTVARHISVLASLHRAFAKFADSPNGSSDAPRPTSDQVFLALRDVLAALAEERPVVVLLDDIQWADEVTIGALKLMVGGSLLQRPVFFLATCRDDELSAAVAPLFESASVERIFVGPLPERNLRALVADMLGVGEPPDAVVNWIAARAEGNPFLAAEYLRLVVSEVPMARELALPIVRVQSPAQALLDALPTPGSVLELAGRRLGLLDDGSLRVAELVAVLGGAIDASVLEGLTAAPQARDAFVELEKRQLVQRTADGGAKLIHDRIRVVAVDRLSLDRKLSHHREAARLLSAAREPMHGAVARHFEQAGMLEEAMPHMERAGEVALSRAAYEAAAHHFDDARAAATELSRRGVSFAPLRRVRWEHGAARAHFGRGDLVMCEERVRDALAVIGEGLPRGRGGWIAMAVRQAVANASRRTSPEDDAATAVLLELSSAASLLPHRYFYEEDMLPVLGTSLLAANLAGRGRTRAAAGPSSNLGAMAGLFRLPRIAQRFFDEGHASAASGHHWRDAAQAHVLESFYHGGFGRWREAETAADRAAAACANTTDPWMRENVETTLSHVEFFTGRFAAARGRAERLAELARDRQNEQHEVWGLYLQARSDIPLGRLAPARRLLEEALARLVRRSEVISEIACSGMLAEVCLGEGEVTRAESLSSAVVERVMDRLPTAYPSLVGYTGAARVFRHLVETAPTPARSRMARQIAIALWRFASVFPVASPSAHLHTAHLLRVHGFARAAHRLFLRGAAQAESRSMPYERALNLRGAATTARGAAHAKTLDASASAILEGIGASHNITLPQRPLASSFLSMTGD